MGLISLLGSLVVAALFAVAGVGKLADRAGARRAVEQFGVPARAAALVAAAIPAAELVVATAMLVPSLRRPAALASVVLLAVFSAAVVRVLRRGERPDCHCFGTVHSTPVGATTLARNGALIALSLLVAWIGPRSLGPVDVGRVAVIVTAAALVAAIVVQSSFIFGLLRRYGEVLLRLEAIEGSLTAGIAAGSVASAPASSVAAEAWGGLPLGTLAPDFDLAVAGAGGQSQTLSDFVHRRGRVLLVFSDPGCAPCQALMPDVAGWQRQNEWAAAVAVVSAGPLDAVAAYAADHGLVDVFADPDREIGPQFQYLGTPGAVVVDASMRVASRVAAGADAIRELVGETVRGRPSIPVRAEPVAPPAVLRVGDDAPDFELRDINGRLRRRSDLLGEVAVLLFWSPACGFCQRMAEDLRAWEADADAGAPHLVLIAAGDASANRALGLTSTLLLDPQQSVTAAYRVAGTPIGIMLDPDGSVSAPPLVGADAVLGALRSAMVANNQD